MSTTERQISTAVSDLVLAVASLHAAFKVMVRSLPAAAGYLLVAAAAALGVGKFGLSQPSWRLVLVHRYASWLATVLGMPCIAVGYARLYDHGTLANAHVASALALLAVHRYLAENVKDRASDIVSGGAIISILGVSVLYFNPYGILGAACYIGAGLAIGTEGQLYGLLRVDLFHYVLVIGNIALLLGLANQAAPVYYKPRS